MALPTRLTFHNCGYRLDGGSAHLYARDETGTEHVLTLWQHASVSPVDDDQRTPGRLYFDEDIAPIRSAIESELLNLLKGADFDVAPAITPNRVEKGPRRFAVGSKDIEDFLSSSPEDNVRRLVANIIAFVESEEYVSFAEKVDRARGLA